MFIQRISKLLVIGLILAFVLPLEHLGAQGVDPNRKLNIIVVTHALCSWDQFWCTEEKAVRDAGTAVNADVKILGPDKFDLERTAALIDQAVAAKPDGLLVTVTDPVLFKEPLMRAIKAGIPVIAFNAGAGPEKDNIPYLTLFAQDEYAAGYQAAERLIQAAGQGQHQGVCINHGVGSSWGDTRCKGFSDAMAKANFKAQVLGIGDDPAVATTTISDFYTANPATDIFLTLGPNGANPFYAFAKNQKLDKDKAFHGTFDVSPEIADNIKSGLTRFGIDQQPYIQGYYAVTSMHLLLRYGIKPTLQVSPTGPGFVTVNDIDLLKSLAGKYR